MQKNWKQNIRDIGTPMFISALFTRAKRWKKLSCPSIYRRSVLGIHWKDWCWSWNSNTLATSCEKLTHLKRPWCWERLRAGGEGDDRGWDGGMASATQWTWVWVESSSCQQIRRPGVLRFMGLQRVRHDWAIQLNWINKMWHVHTTEYYSPFKRKILLHTTKCINLEATC